MALHPVLSDKLNEAPASTPPFPLNPARRAEIGYVRHPGGLEVDSLAPISRGDRN